MTNDPHRPQYHFMPPANWMNDPNGLIQWRGQYHMFYQHNPDEAYWGPMCWGHAVSTDLVHWTHLPIALAPTPGGADKDGCWSGCAVNNDGVPVLIYTGVRPQVQCLALPDDPNDPNLVQWHPYEGNPIIAGPPAGLGLTDDFRDPCIWREGKTWYMVVGSSVRDVGGIILLYRSPDLVHWEYVQPILTGDKTRRDPFPTGTMWECPNFFALEGRHVLTISAMGMEDGSRYTAYFIGKYENFTFKPDVLHLLDYGRQQFYAPQAFADERGRRIMFGWLVENRPRAAFSAAGWAGVMSLPRVLTLRPDGTLGMEPAPEVERLRGKGRRWENIALSPSPDKPTAWDGVRGDALELLLEFAPARTGRFGLLVRRSPDGHECTRIVYDAQTRQLALDTTQSSLDDEVGKGIYSGPVDLWPGEGLSLRVFLDRSVVEVYANGRACISGRIYPTLPGSQEVSLFADCPMQVMQAEVWPIPPTDLGPTG